MLIGDKRQLALELTPTERGFCGAALWIGGAQIGNPEEYGVAGALAEAFEGFRKKEPLRDDEALFSLEANELLDQVDEALFGDSGELDNAILGAQRFGPFLLSPNLCESLDDYLIVVVSRGNSQRVIARSCSGGDSLEAFIPKRTLEQAMSTAERLLWDTEKKRRASETPG
jgi:hypothetical protein